MDYGPNSACQLLSFKKKFSWKLATFFKFFHLHIVLWHFQAARAELSSCVVVIETV